MKPLIFLESRLIINSIKNIFRSPKRLIPVLLIAAWVIGWFFQSIAVFFMSRQTSNPRIDLLAGIPVTAIESLVFIMLSILSVFTLYNAFNTGILVFSISHIDFLFPTPIPRKSVMIVKLIMDYIKYGFMVLWFCFMLMPIFMESFSLLGVQLFPWIFISISAVTALIILVVNIAHIINIIFSFGYQRLDKTGAIIKTLLIAVPVVAVLVGVISYVNTGGDISLSVYNVASSPILAAIFTPARWAAKLFLAPLIGITSDGWAQFGSLWILVLMSFLILISRKENFYEPSIVPSIKHSKRRMAMKSGNTTILHIDNLLEKGTTNSGLLNIPPFGSGASALIWKNILVKLRTSLTKILILAIFPFVLFYAAKQLDLPDIMLKFLPVFLFYLVFFLSIMSQLDMRSELAYANIIKSMPVASWKVIFVQTITSIIYVTVIVLLIALSIFVILPEAINQYFIASIITIPFICFAGVPAILIPCILYPDTKDITQNYLSNMVAFLLLPIALIPTVAFSLLFLIILRVEIIYLIVTLMVVNIAMGFAGVALGGYLFSKFDPTGN